MKRQASAISSRPTRRRTGGRVAAAAALLTALTALAALVALTASSALASTPTTFAETGRDAGQIYNPRGMAVDQSSGNVYIADENNQRVDEFDAAGGFLMAFGFGVRTGAEALETCTAATGCIEGLNAGSTRNYNAGALYGPRGIAADSGHIWVSDELNRVTEFDSSGEALRVFGGDAVAYGPDDSTVDGVQRVTVKAEGGTFKLKLTNPFTGSGTAGTTALNYNAPAVDPGTPGVIDSVQEALEALSTIGGLGGSVTVTGGPGDATGSSPYQITFEGNLGGDFIPKLTTVNSLTGTTHTVTVSVLTAGGAPEVCEPAGGDVCKNGTAGTANGQFQQSAGPLAVDGSGNLWVGDQNRVQKFGPGGAYLAGVTLAGRGNTRALAVNSAGTKIYVISAEAPYNSSVRTYDTSTGTELGSPIDDVAGEYKTIALDSSENLFVADRPADGDPAVFREFNPAGEQIEQFGAGQVFGIGGPEGIAVGADALYSNSFTLVNGEHYAAQLFPLPEPGPLPQNEEAVDVLPTTATLKATINPENHATTYHFEYDTAPYNQGEGPHGTSVPTPPGTLAASFEEEPIEAPLTELIPSTEYHFRLVAEDSLGRHVEGPDQTFETLPPVAFDAEWATEVAATSASFHAELDPLGAAAEWWVEYDTAPYNQGEGPHGTSVPTPPGTLAASFGDVSVDAHVQNLEPATTYHYRFAARDERDGAVYTVHGEDRTIVTQLTAPGFQLPDGRAWEMVSPADKGVGTVVLAMPGGEGTGVAQASAGGAAITYLSMAPVDSAPEGNRALELSQVLARRGEEGWRSKDITTPYTTVTGLTAGVGSEYRFFSSDLSTALLEHRDTNPLSEEASERTPYLRDNLADPATYRPLVTGKEGYANVPPGTEFGGEPTNPLGEVHVRGASPDLSHVALRSSVPLVEGAPGGGQGALYEWAAGQLRVVSALPADEGGAAVSGELGAGVAGVRNAVSEDGSRVFWNPGSEGSPGSALYVRVRDTATEEEETVRLDVVQPGATGSGSHTPVFQGASADGSRAFFTDTQRLTADASNSGADLYECEVMLSAGELGCTLTDLTANGAEGARVQGILPGLGEDGTHVYLVANGVLAPGAAPGDCTDKAEPAATCNLYALHYSPDSQEWATEFVATLSNEDAGDWGSGLGPANRAVWAANLSAASSPSGRYLAFMSERSLTGYDNRDAASGAPDQEVYRYDAATNRPVCVSCNPDGARPAGALEARGEAGLPTLPAIDPTAQWADHWLAASTPNPKLISLTYSASQPRFVLDDGRLFFNAADGLVPGDVNSAWDVYQYEPTGTGSCADSSGGAAVSRTADGCVALVSSGVDAEETGFIDASASGDDAFLLTGAKLSPEDTDARFDVYDAHVCGSGWQCEPPPPAPPAPCVSSSACHPFVSGGGEAGAPASSSFAGVGNVNAQRHRKHHKKHHKRRHHRHAKRVGHSRGGVK